MSNTPTPPARLLIVDDDPIVARSLAELLNREGYEAEHVNSASAAMNVLRDAAKPFQLLITDLKMPHTDGLDLLRHVRQYYEDLAVLVITGYGSIESAVEAVRLGAFDYLTKPIIDDELVQTIDRALRRQALMGEQEDRDDHAGIVGAHARMQRVFELVDMVGSTKTTALIQGESGTGKTKIARAIHDQSPRADKPFITMACGSIPESLLESELFGHKKGAFTGADSDKEGKLLAANGGTLFIDEINSATPGLQLKLLRVLQDRQFEPVGSHETIEVDVRFILACNESLEVMIEAGTFREDLYYRINVVKLDLPPLRQRGDDVLLLANHFLAKYANEAGKVVTGFDEQTSEIMRRYQWPGNVRELENAVERAVVLTPRPIIEPDVLPDKVRFQKPDGRPGYRERRREGASMVPEVWTPQPLREALKDPEKTIILQALQANDWNRQKTAEVLDINRTTLYKKIRAYGLDEPAPA